MQFNEHKQLGRKIVNIVYNAKSGIPIGHLSKMIEDYSEVITVCKVNELIEKQILKMLPVDNDLMVFYNPPIERNI